MSFLHKAGSLPSMVIVLSILGIAYFGLSNGILSFPPPSTHPMAPMYFGAMGVLVVVWHIYMFSGGRNGHR